MKRVLTAVVLVPLALLAILKAPFWLFPLLVMAVVFLGIHEYLNIVKGYGVEPMQWLVYVAAGLVVLVAFVEMITGAFLLYGGQAFLLLIALLCALPVIFRKDLRKALLESAAGGFGILYIAIPLSLLIQFQQDPFFLLMVLFSVWSGDIAAYYVGSAIGKHKLAPVVSPKKSWEGAVASLIASTAVVVLFFRYRNEIGHLLRIAPASSIAVAERSIPWTFAVPLGVVTNIAAQLGDLFESAIKRGAQVKDSGGLLPGHGGVLDRIDALLFAVPAAWFYATLRESLAFYFR